MDKEIHKQITFREILERLSRFQCPLCNHILDQILHSEELIIYHCNNCNRDIEFGINNNEPYVGLGKINRESPNRHGRVIFPSLDTITYRS